MDAGGEKTRFVVDRSHLQSLLDVLILKGYRLCGPTVRDGAIVFDTIQSVTDLPEGWTEVQEAGQYRLRRREDRALFGFTVGPHSWKKYLLEPRKLLWRAQREGDRIRFIESPADSPALAFIGVRACDLNAIAVQDRVLLDLDAGYRANRARAFLIAVNCSAAAPTCFCASMNTGPMAESGFDLALNEVIEGERHYFVTSVGSARGNEVLSAVPHWSATAAEAGKVEQARLTALTMMGRELDTRGIRDLFYRNYENPRWDEVATRCLSCANCTLACPTCFCNSVEDVSDLSGGHAERWRKWDSCFQADFSYLHGGSIRQSTRSRYRQWISHKLATWIDQFGTSGCVGCGRCITWCPVGIDITEEVSALRASEVNHGNRVD